MMAIITVIDQRPAVGAAVAVERRARGTLDGYLPLMKIVTCKIVSRKTIVPRSNDISQR
jgi:hypothetical protein